MIESIGVQAEACPSLIVDNYTTACTLSSGSLTIRSSGSIKVTDNTAITIDSGLEHVALTNYGTICGNPNGVVISGASTNVTIVNDGTIEGTKTGIGGLVKSLSGSGSISGGSTVDCK